MNRHRFTAALTYVAALMATASLAQAQTPAAEASPFIVIGAADLPDFEGSDASQTVPFVVGRFETLGVDTELEGLQARWNLRSDYGLRAGPLLAVRLPRGDSVDAAAVARMAEIDVAIEPGAFVGFEVPLCRGINRTDVASGCSIDTSKLSGNLSLRGDMTGTHDSVLATADLRYFFKMNRMLRISVGANATVAGDGYARTYFGVSGEDAARSGLPQFDASGGLRDIGVEAFSILSFSERYGVFTRVALNRLMGDAADSPVVTEGGDETQRFVGAGLFIRF